MCKSLAGNDVELLTITSFTSEPDELSHRKGVVISARVHPGESNASFMMQGVIDYLTGPSLDAKVSYCIYSGHSTDHSAYQYT